MPENITKEKPAISRPAATPPETGEAGLRWEKRICFAAVAAALTAATLLFRYAHPWADDFSRAYKGRVNGVIRSTEIEYFTWTGRWASSGLNYLLLSSFDIVRFYPLLLFVIPTLLTIAIYLLLRAGRIGAGRIQSLALAAAAAALYWSGLPQPGENVYWLTGSIDNLAGFAVSLLLLAGLLYCERPMTFRGQTAAGAGLSLLAFSATGFHEVFGLLLCIALAGGTFRAWLAGAAGRQLWTICLAAAIIGFLVVYVAPGNEVRRSEFPLAADLETTVRLTLRQGVSSVFFWILDPRLLAGTALLPMLMPEALAARGRSVRRSGLDVPIVALTWIAAVGAGFGAVSWAIGMKMAPRTLNGLYLVFLVGWFWLFVTIARRWFAGRIRPVASPLLRRAAGAVFVAALLLTGNMPLALADLRGTAPVYSAALDRRWQKLASAEERGDSDAVVEPLPPTPRLFIKFFELSADPDHWVNWSIAHYFGLRSVRLAGEPENAAGKTE